MQSPSRWMKVGIVALGIGAGSLPAQSAVPRPHPGPPPPPPMIGERACATWRWIGILRSGVHVCPNLGGRWAPPRPLFAPREDAPRNPDRGKKSRAGEAGAAAEDEPSLDRFCVYEYQGGAPEPKSLSTVPAPPYHPDLVRLDPDCAALAPTGGPADLFGMTAELFHEHFLQEVGRAGKLKSDQVKGKVRLSFVDTQPTGIGVPGTPGNSLHGYTLAQLGRELVSLDAPGACKSGLCPQPTCTGTDRACAAQITTRLALKVVRFYPGSEEKTVTDEQKGGFFGTLSDLAAAIHDEVQCWESAARGDPNDHLVLNLSVGWDGETFGGLEKCFCDFRAPVAAVYEALQYAASRGVLVIAAAGNLRSCPAQGPMLPAAWEGKIFRGGCSPGRQKLVYAAGGIQSDDSRLVNERPGSMPPRAAYADHAVVTDLLGNPLPPMTGTSVAAAVVSSIAAVVWAKDPTLKPERVMDQVMRKDLTDPNQKPSVFLPYHSDFPTPTQTVRKVRLCTALDIPCPDVDSNFADELQKARAPFKPQVTLSVSVQKLGTQPADSACPAADFPWDSSDDCMYPQPNSEPCLTCQLAVNQSSSGLSASLYTELNNGVVGTVMPTGLNLTCDGQSNTVTLASSTCLPANGTATLSITSQDLCSAPTAATLTFKDCIGGTPSPDNAWDNSPVTVH